MRARGEIKQVQNASSQASPCGRQEEREIRSRETLRSRDRGSDDATTQNFKKTTGAQDSTEKKIMGEHGESPHWMKCPPVSHNHPWSRDCLLS